MSFFFFVFVPVVVREVRKKKTFDLFFFFFIVSILSAPNSETRKKLTPQTRKPRRSISTMAQIIKRMLGMEDTAAHPGHKGE